MRIVYLSLYQSIFQYGIVAWGGTYENSIKPLIIQQNKIVRICLNKNTVDGSTKINYKDFGVLPVSLLYKKFATLFIMKNVLINNNIVYPKRNRTYNISVHYTNKNIGQKFIDYLGPTIFNSMPLNLKKHLKSNPNTNHKKTIVNWLLKEL
jgi:hypothetical protein